MDGKPGKESEMKILIGKVKFFSENKMFGYIALNKKSQGKDPTDYWFHGGNLCDPIAMFPYVYFRRRYVGDAMEIDKNLRMENFTNLAGREVAFTGVEGQRGFKASSWMFKERYEEEYQKLLTSPKYRLMRHTSSFRSSAITQKVLWQGRDTASLSIEFPVESYWDDVEQRMIQAIQISPLVRGDGSTIRHSFEMENPENGEWLPCEDPRVELCKVIA
jgi:hypothetical protein